MIGFSSPIWTAQPPFWQRRRRFGHKNVYCDMIGYSTVITYFRLFIFWEDCHLGYNKSPTRFDEDLPIWKKFMLSQHLKIYLFVRTVESPPSKLFNKNMACGAVNLFINALKRISFSISFEYRFDYWFELNFNFPIDSSFSKPILFVYIRNRI